MNPANLTSSRKTPRWTISSVSTFLLSAMICLDAVGFLSLGVPANSIAMGALVFQGIFFSVPHYPWQKWLVIFTLAVPIWLALTSLLNGDFDLRRILNICLYAALVLVVAHGRLKTESIRRGLALSVAIGICWGAATLYDGAYSGRLTGPFGDPNAGGLIIIVCSALAVPSFSRAWSRIGILCIAVAGVWMTESRTTLLAMVIMAIWVLLRKFSWRWIAASISIATLWWVNSWPEDLYSSGLFAARAGSDALRERIQEIEDASVQIHPIIGNGAGTANIFVDGNFFYFHSSYLAIRAEAGWIGFVIVIGLLVFTFLGLLRLPRTTQNLWYEAAIIGIAITALNLGEVLLTLPTALAIGLSALHINQAHLNSKIIYPLQKKL